MKIHYSLSHNTGPRVPGLASTGPNKGPSQGPDTGSTRGSTRGPAWGPTRSKNKSTMVTIVKSRQGNLRDLKSVCYRFVYRAADKKIDHSRGLVHCDHSVGTMVYQTYKHGRSRHEKSKPPCQ